MSTNDHLPTNNNTYLEKSNWLSYIFMSFMNKVLKIGNKKIYEYNDLYKLDDFLQF